MKDGIFCAALSIAIGYLIGNLNPAYLLGRRKGIDVRNNGSGNAGASNAFILFGKSAFLITAVTDISKAWAAWKLDEIFFPALTLSGELASSACVLGHMFPAVLHFKGGKGLACLGGLILAFSPKAFGLMLLILLAVLVLSRYIAVGTVAVAVCWPGVYMTLGGHPAGAFLFCATAVPVIMKHRENFARMRTGGELRIDFFFKRAKELERISFECEKPRNEES